MAMLPPSTLLAGIELDEFLGHHLARYYMIRQNFDSTVPHGYRRVGARRTTALVVALGPRE